MSIRLPTPTVFGNNNRAGLTEKSGDGLATAVKALRLPTPCAMEPQKDLDAHAAKVAKPRAERGGGNAANLATVMVAAGDGQLNPDFVEWLMNWPIGWTSLDPLPAGTMEEWRERTLAGTWWNFPPPVPGMASGITRRIDRIRCIGNGQVPGALILALKYLARSARE
jgi:hypothetical protein